MCLTQENINIYAACNNVSKDNWESFIIMALYTMSKKTLQMCKVGITMKEDK